ncbi:MAG: hemerythrin domain-containing protein [Pseudomonadota bacterium]
MRVPPIQSAIHVIHEEHDLLQAIIHGMLHLVHDIANGKPVPDLKIFRAMLFYIKEYPDKVHHPKENRYLFALLRKRSNQLDATIAELESQHIQGDSLVAEMEHALARYELSGTPTFRQFHDMVERYAAFYRNHMRIEENEILPAAMKILTPDDWSVINDAFSSNTDPRGDAGQKPELQKLFSLIVNIAPPPVGVGPAVS